VERKVSNGVARIKLGLDQKLHWATSTPSGMGVRTGLRPAMWLMLQQDVPSDFVVASGETHSVRELCELAFGAADLDWEEHVVVDEKFMRPAEVDLLVGDATRRRRSSAGNATSTSPRWWR